MTPRLRVANRKRAVSVKRQKLPFPYKALQIKPGLVSLIGDETETFRGRRINTSP